VQKRAIQMARENAKPVIVATQMLESMIENSRPTRPRLRRRERRPRRRRRSDVVRGNFGRKYPLAAVRTMARIICAVEENSTAARR